MGMNALFFALGVRGDVGFRSFALIMIFPVVAKLSGRLRPLWQTLLVAAVIGCLFSLTADTFQKGNLT